MRPMYDSEVEVFRGQVQSFLKANLSDDWQGIGTLPADEAQAWVTEWRKVLYQQRYLAPVGQRCMAAAECRHLSR